MITNRKGLTKEALELEMKAIAERLSLKSHRDALYFPKFFQIETTRLCNARCSFCAIEQWDKSVPHMSDTLFEKVAKELGEYKDWVEMVAIQRAGEPLLDKKLGPRIRRLKEAGVRRVSIATNASLLTEKKARELLGAGLDEVWMSIDSVDKENYEKMRVRLKYEVVMANIESFFKVRDELKPDMHVRVRGVSFFNLTKGEERKELERWENFWSRFRKPQDRIYMKQAHNWGNQVVLEARMQSRNNEIDGNYGEIYHPCILPWSTLHVTAMGLVPLCPMDYDAKMNLGDVNVDTIADIWKNSKWARIREAHQSGERNKIEMCRGCKLFDLDFSIEKKHQKELYES